MSAKGWINLFVLSAEIVKKGAFAADETLISNEPYTHQKMH